MSIGSIPSAYFVCLNAEHCPFSFASWLLQLLWHEGFLLFPERGARFIYIMPSLFGKKSIQFSFASRRNLRLVDFQILECWDLTQVADACVSDRGVVQSDALEFFDTPHNLQAADLCKMHGFNYLSAKNLNELSAGLANFYAPSEKPVLLELFTPPEINDEVLKNYFKSLR